MAVTFEVRRDFIAGHVERELLWDGRDRSGASAAAVGRRQALGGLASRCGLHRERGFHGGEVAAAHSVALGDRLVLGECRPNLVEGQVRTLAEAAGLGRGRTDGRVPEHVVLEELLDREGQLAAGVSDRAEVEDEDVGHSPEHCRVVVRLGQTILDDDVGETMEDGLEPLQEGQVEGRRQAAQLLEQRAVDAGLGRSFRRRGAVGGEQDNAHALPHDRVDELAVRRLPLENADAMVRGENLGRDDHERELVGVDGGPFLEGASREEPDHVEVPLAEREVIPIEDGAGVFLPLLFDAETESGGRARFGGSQPAVGPPVAAELGHPAVERGGGVGAVGIDGALHANVLAHRREAGVTALVVDASRQTRRDVRVDLPWVGEGAEVVGVQERSAVPDELELGVHDDLVAVAGVRHTRKGRYVLGRKARAVVRSFGQEPGDVERDSARDEVRRIGGAGYVGGGGGRHRHSLKMRL